MTGHCSSFHSNEVLRGRCQCKNSTLNLIYGHLIFVLQCHTMLNGKSLTDILVCNTFIWSPDENNFYFKLWKKLGQNSQKAGWGCITNFGWRLGRPTRTKSWSMTLAFTPQLTYDVVANCENDTCFLNGLCSKKFFRIFLASWTKGHLWPKG